MAKKELRELEGVLDKELESLCKMEFAEFKGDAAKHLTSMYSGIFTLAEQLVEERKKINDGFKMVLDRLNERDELYTQGFELRDYSLDGLAAEVHVLVCEAKRGLVSEEDKKTITECMGYRWCEENEGLIRNRPLSQCLV